MLVSRLFPRGSNSRVSPNSTKNARFSPNARPNTVARYNNDEMQVSMYLFVNFLLPYSYRMANSSSSQLRHSPIFATFARIPQRADLFRCLSIFPSIIHYSLGRFPSSSRVHDNPCTQRYSETNRVPTELSAFLRKSLALAND